MSALSSTPSGSSHGWMDGMRWPFSSRDSDLSSSMPAGQRERAAGPTDSDADVVNAIAAEHLPEGIRESWLRLLRPAVHLVPAPDGSRPVARLGGLPDLPEGIAWPTWSGHGPLSYVGEILCASLADFELDVPLPATGRMLFFYFDGSDDHGASTVGTWDASTLDGARAFHVDHDVPHAPRGVPEGLGVYPERWLAGRQILTAPGWEHPDLAAAFMSPDEDDESFMDHPVNADDFNEELQERHGAPLHQIGGYAHPVQGPVEDEVALAALDNQVPHGDARLDTEARRWELLLQIDTDDDVDMSWGDAGVLYWMARPDETASGDFSKISFTWQCG